MLAFLSALLVAMVIIIYLLDLQMLQTLDDILVNSIIKSLTLLMAICNWYHTLCGYKYINKGMVILWNNVIMYNTYTINSFIMKPMANRFYWIYIGIFIKSEITMQNNQISKYCKLNGI